MIIINITFKAYLVKFDQSAILTSIIIHIYHISVLIQHLFILNQHTLKVDNVSAPFSCLHQEKRFPRYKTTLIVQLLLLNVMKLKTSCIEQLIIRSGLVIAMT